MNKASCLNLISTVMDPSDIKKRRQEFEDLANLLLTHRSSTNDIAESIAYWIAYSCLGENHLWQDMGLLNRKELSSIMEHHFKPLFGKNTDDMKWKKFFYKQLCEMEGLNLCRAPSCGACVDYQKCFGPED